MPIVGVNTFLSKDGSPTIIPDEVIRSTEEERKHQIDNLNRLHSVAKERAENQLSELQKRAVENENLFEALMEAAKVCSLGQITHALYEVGGQYRRNK